MNYTLSDALRIESDIDEAIRLLRILRSSDGYSIYDDGTAIYNRATEAVQRAINHFESFYSYAYEGYYAGRQGDYNLACKANEMAIKYNRMLDLAE